MSMECRTVQEALVEKAGRRDQLAPEVQEHLRLCSECSRFAEAERDLHSVFVTALPPEDPALIERILLAVHDRRLFRQIARWLPLAASALIVLGCVALLGGLPGAGLLAAIPGTTAGGGTLGLGGALLAWMRALEVAARVLAGFVPAWVPLAGLGVAVLGLLLCRRMVRAIKERS